MRQVFIVLILSITLSWQGVVFGNNRLKVGADSFIDYMQDHSSISVLDFIKVFSSIYDYHIGPLRSRGDLVFTDNPMEIKIPKLFGEEVKKVSGTFINEAKQVDLTKAGKKKNITIKIPETIKGYFIRSKDYFALIFDENHTLHINIYFFDLKIDKAEATRQHVKIGIANFPDITKEF